MKKIITIIITVISFLFINNVFAEENPVTKLKLKNWDEYYLDGYSFYKNSQFIEKYDAVSNYDKLWLPEYHYFKLSPNKESFLFIAKKWNKYFVVKDWIKWEEFDGIFEWLVLYSSDWTDYSYIWINWNNKYLIKNWKKIDLWFLTDIYDPFQYIPNSNKVIFFWWNNWKKYIVVDWLKWEEFDTLQESISEFWIIWVDFSWDWKNYFYFWKKDWKWNLIKNTNKILTFDADNIDNWNYWYYLKFINSTNWEKYAFTFSKWNNTYVVHNWVISEGYNSISNIGRSWWLVFSDDFSNLAYIANKNWTEYFIVNGKIVKNLWNNIATREISYNSKDDSFQFPFQKDRRWTYKYNLTNKNLTSYEMTINDVKIVNSFSDKYKLLSEEKKNNIKNKLTEILSKLKAWTKNYEIVKQILEITK